MKYNKVWITGASSGIGRALSIEYANQGSKLILSGRNIAELEKTKSLCQNAKHVVILPIDISQLNEINTLLDANRVLLNDVDLLINNAGISQRSLALETDFEVHKRLMDVNYFGTLKLTLWMLQHFKENNSGHIATISSVAGKFGTPMRSGYSASKFALHGFFEALHAELVETNIKVTMICPGFIQTNISKNAIIADGRKQGTMDNATSKGMNVESFAKKAVSAINKNKFEVSIGNIYETKFALFIHRIFPSLFRKLIAKSKVT